jgi:hypothetical protein
MAYHGRRPDDAANGALDLPLCLEFTGLLGRRSMRTLRPMGSGSTGMRLSCELC